MTARLPKWILLGLAVLLTASLGVSSALASHYRIEVLDVFDEGALEALRSVGIESTEDYLRATVDPDERRALAAETGISELEVLVFARLCELLQIDGVGPRAAQLLRASGVVSAADLGSRDPAELLERVGAVNRVEQLTGISPTIENLVTWIEAAQSVAYHVE